MRRLPRPACQPARGHQVWAEEALNRLDHRDRRLAEHPEPAAAVEAAARGEPGAQTHGGGRLVRHELVTEVVEGAGNSGDAVEDLHTPKIVPQDSIGQGDLF
jgi:hypothetical protein